MEGTVDLTSWCFEKYKEIENPLTSQMKKKILITLGKTKGA